MGDLRLNIFKIAFVTLMMSGCVAQNDCSLVGGGCFAGPTPVPTPIPACACSTTAADSMGFGGDGSDDGSAAHPYKVCTRSHLAAIDSGITSQSGWVGKYFEQCTAINLGGSATPFTPIGYGVGPFKGNYIGHDQTISNCYYHNDVALKVGLFNEINTGSVSNLVLSNFDVRADGKVGALAGVITGSETVSNVTVSNVTAASVLKYGVGGVVGEVGGYGGDSDNGNTFSYVSVSGTVTRVGGGGVDTSFPGGIGGFVGSSFGIHLAAPNTYSHCSSTVTVSHNTAGVATGGFAGYTDSGTIHSYSSFNGTVTANTQAVGGLSGITDGGPNDIQISNSYTSGTITNNRNAEPANGGWPVEGTGGLVGISYRGQFTNCYSSATVSSVNRGIAGGIIGGPTAGSNTVITQSYATGNITGNDNVGGLAGWSYFQISSSFATGNIASTGVGAGGLVGLQNGNASISNSYATGSVSGNDSVGGLIGNASQNATYGITQSYSFGLVSGSSNVGGFCGQANASSIAASSANFYSSTVNAAGGAVIASGVTTTAIETPATETGAGWPTAGATDWKLISGLLPDLNWH